MSRKTLIVLAVVAALAIGYLLLKSKRQVTAPLASQWIGLPPVPTPSGATNKGGVLDQLAKINGAGAAAICRQQGGPAAACDILDKVNTLSVQQFSVAGGVVASGAKKAASAAKSGLKAIVPFW